MAPCSALIFLTLVLWAHTDSQDTSTVAVTPDLSSQTASTTAPITTFQTTAKPLNDSANQSSGTSTSSVLLSSSTKGPTTSVSLATSVSVTESPGSSPTTSTMSTSLSNAATSPTHSGSLSPSTADHTASTASSQSQTGTGTKALPVSSSISTSVSNTATAPTDSGSPSPSTTDHTVLTSSQAQTGNGTKGLPTTSVSVSDSSGSFAANSSMSTSVSVSDSSGSSAANSSMSTSVFNAATTQTHSEASSSSTADNTTSATYSQPQTTATEASSTPTNESSVTPGHTASNTSTLVLSLSTQGTIPSTLSPASKSFSDTSYQVNIEELTVPLDFSIKFNTRFSSDLHNASSKVFNETKQNYTALLTTVYDNTPGFERVEITKFWEGSIGVEYKVVYKARINISQLKETLNSTEGNLTALPDADGGYVRSVFQRELNAALDLLRVAENDPCQAFNPCPEFYTCSPANETQINCTSPCANYKCNEPHGKCELNRTGNAVCRCDSDNRYIYGGVDCGDKAEKMLLSSEYIIGIAGGVGGGVVLILVIALVVVCCRKGGKGDNSDRKSVASFHSDFNDAAQGRDKSDASYHLYNEPLESRYQHMKRQDSGLPAQEPLVGGVSSPAPPAPDSAAEGGRAAYGRDGRVYRAKDEITIYSPEERPFFRNQAFESFPEPGPFRTSEVISSRGAQRPFGRQSADSFNPLVHSGAHPYNAPASRQVPNEPWPSSGNRRYESAWTDGNPESRDSRGIEDRSQYVTDGRGRSDRPSAEDRDHFPRIPAGAETGLGNRGYVYDYTAWGARKTK